jgi:hypothetical protein
MYFTKDIKKETASWSAVSPLWNYDTDRIVINAYRHGSTDVVPMQVYGFKVGHESHHLVQGQAPKSLVGSLDLHAISVDQLTRMGLRPLDWRDLMDLLDEPSFEVTHLRVNGYRIESIEPWIRKDGRLLNVNLIYDAE